MVSLLLRGVLWSEFRHFGIAARQHPAGTIAEARVHLRVSENPELTPEDGIDHIDFAKWQYSIALKQFGYARFAQLVLPGMRATPA